MNKTILTVTIAENASVSGATVDLYGDDFSVRRVK
jgi:hypothetical protein